MFQLDLENTALASTCASSAAVVNSNVDEDLDPAAIVEKMLRLKDLYGGACDRMDKPNDLYGKLNGNAKDVRNRLL